PVLIGTTSIEDSEYLSKLLKKRKLPHHVLNAKYHEKEAMIVAQAGRLGAITIATNMAGRGTDILLGGNPEYRARQEVDPNEEPEKYRELLEKYKKEAEEERKKIVKKVDPDTPYGRWVLSQIKKWCQETGRPFREEEWRDKIYKGGLHVIGCQRHEARRIDDQLAGRAGRQGDPGSAQFFLSLEDDLLRIFGGERLANLMDRLGIKEGEAIEHELLTSAIRRAQKRVEERNFEIRKRLLEYDEIMAKQREAIYAIRERFLLPAPGEEPDNTELFQYLEEIVSEYAEIVCSRHAQKNADPSEWDLKGLTAELSQVLASPPTKEELRRLGDYEELVERVRELLLSQLEAQRERLAPHFPTLARIVILRTVDENWRQHLLELDDLREGIYLRAYGGRDPLIEFKREAHRLFQEMILRTEEQVVRFLLSPRLVIREAPPVPGRRVQGRAARPPVPQPVASTTAPKGSAAPSRATRHASSKKVGRNDPCPCGSGKKYKHCCGRNA
ncbi:SEC-C domain-containing protein, partial [Candidatus Bipolaricaulota bacterium]|nr:SEC-C domain-containing protein [Candidatus Bipolaricaulota bacterium]